MDWTETPSGPLDAGGTAIDYACFGPAPDAAPTIVMLHEGLGCVALWRDFPRRLAEATGCGVLVYSRPGYGQSAPRPLPWPLDVMTREALETLPAVLDAAGIRTAVLFGHSDGATIAAIYAGSVVDTRVRGLILMAPHFFTEPEGLAQIAQVAEAYDGGLRDKLAPYHRDPDMAFGGWSGVWLDPAFRDWSVADAIDYLRIPTLAIQGREDQYGTLAQIEELETRSYAPVDTLILDDCRHAPHQEHPDMVLQAVAEFTARLRRIEAAEVETA